MLLRLFFCEGLYLVGKRNCNSSSGIIAIIFFEHDDLRITIATFPMGDGSVE
jgi:hypothetical protein